MLDDDALEREISRNWSETDDDDDEYDDDDEVGRKKLSAKDMVVYDWEVDENSEQEDLIEIYDEDGELVRTYTAYEYERLRSSNNL